MVDWRLDQPVAVMLSQPFQECKSGVMRGLKEGDVKHSRPKFKLSHVPIAVEVVPEENSVYQGRK